MVISKNTYTDQVMSFIYDTILKGRLKPGDRISETWLAETLSISRAPIREAMRLLARDGLIDYRPQVGNFVASPSAKQINEAYITRGVLEGFAASYAIDSFNEKDFMKLDKLVAKMVEAARQDHHYTLANIDKQFHEYILMKSESAHLIELTKTLGTLLHLLFCTHWTKVYQPEQIRFRHQQIVDTMRGGDRQSIEICLREHYIQTGRLMSQFGSDKRA
jgi:GntR family transcriptional regulator, rspAB operon transcriptional repressor